MRLLAVIAVLLVSSVASASSAAPTTSTKRPTLAITTIVPLRIAGSGFRPNELVRLAAESRRRNVRADARGRFTTSLPPVDPCNGFIVTAVGGKGSRASIAFNATWRVHCIAP
ncbi:MAG TPA: hypothetical protein VFM83_02395 [Gaiellaceae bacterium]|nr:hypothetical protein [Gaiellaceae bacterium]